MTSVHALAAILAVLSSLGLAAAVLLRAPRGWVQWSFGLGMLAFASESTALFVVLQVGDAPDARLFWLKVVQVAGLVLTVPWGVFAATIGRPHGAPLPRAWRWCLGTGAALAAGAAVAIAASMPFRVVELDGLGYAAQHEAVGRYAAVMQLLLSVGILGVLEAALRAAKRTARWRIKYLLLGLGGIFLVRFYFLADALLFDAQTVTSLTIQATAVFVGNLLMALSLPRRGLIAVSLTLSRHLLYRSVVGGVLGLYLLVVGALGWLLGHLGVPEKLFWGSLVVFVSALGLAAVLLSEDVRWRLKRFIGVHFYRSKYDYRQQWMRFTKRLGSLLTLDELAPELAAAVADAVGSAKAVVYLSDGDEARYRLAGAVGIDDPARTLELPPVSASCLRARPQPFLVSNGEGAAAEAWLGPRLAAAFSDGVVVPLHRAGTVGGILLVGPERTRAPYGAEDLEFLATIGEQAAGAIATARLSETLALSREFDAFHRLTSFVVHDLKNSISALSMLSQNALANFDDPEFQRDAIKTLSRTVNRMKGLLARLSATPESTPLRLQPLDLASLAVEATLPIRHSSRVSLAKALAPVPSIVADPDALLRVIQNLVTNAVEAVNGAGKVTVRTYEEQGWAVLSVSDTGCGMPEDFMRKSLFAPFRSTKKGGWGIGLYQAKGLVEAHDGTIEVASKEGEGTTFWVRLPLERP